LRGWDATLADEQDRLERARTQYVLARGSLPLVLPTLRTLLRAPRAFWRTVRLAVRMAGSAYRPLPYHLAYLAEACQILEWCREGAISHIHAHFGTNSAEVVMLAASLGGPRYSFTAHGPEEFLCPMGLDEKIDRSAFAIAVSSFGRSQLYLHCPYEDWQRIRIVRCGLEREYFDLPWTAAGHPARFVCVGRLSEAKGQLLLIEATAALRAKGQGVELVLAGDGPLRAKLERMIKHYRLQDAVRITGWISSSAVRDEILAARALVLPSFAEGLPVVVMEALALRRPVLTTYVAGIPELVRSGESGWLFPAGSVEELARAMQECLTTSESELRWMGENGRRCVLEHHSVDVEAAKLIDLFAATAAEANSLACSS
jgi:glycosyltransferase involved in cell wall biosynthesis